MKYVVGVDEVGRGPLAGPVSVCLLCCEENLYKKLKKNKALPSTGFDSKKLSKEEREKYAKVLKTISRLSLDKFSYIVVHVSNKTIDAKGISFSIKKAISVGVKKLNLNPKDCKLLLDGSLVAPIEFKRQKIIIKGDEKEKIISWASILAKVERDMIMVKSSSKFPQYGFEFHKGYGTKKHRFLIKKNGLSKIHRQTFCKNLVDT